MKKGIIALDIDGTITAEHHHLPVSVKKYFTELVADGWLLVFITGRTYKWGFEVLNVLDFPFYFALQNGAFILEMPSKRIISKKYLDHSIFPVMDQICRDESSDYIIYSGFEYEDKCYYRPSHFSKKTLSYIMWRSKKLGEEWIPLDSYKDISIDNFASIKCFGKYSDALRLSEKIESELKLHAPLIRDPFDESYYVVQATHSQINKGQALKDLIEILGFSGIIIAAGDDLNDVPMLNVADIKIVMGNAPQEVLKLGHIIAPTAKEEGIIEGLKAAIQGCKGY